ELKGRTKEPVENIELMRSEVEEQTTARHLRSCTPVIRFAYRVGGRLQGCATDGQRTADHAGGQLIPDFCEEWQCPAVMCNGNFYAIFLQRCDHSLTCANVGCDGLFDVDMLPGVHRRQRIFLVKGGRGGNIYRCNFGILKKCLCLIIPTWNAVAQGEIFCLRCIPAHNGHKAGVLYHVEGWT